MGWGIIIVFGSVLGDHSTELTVPPERWDS